MAGIADQEAVMFSTHQPAGGSDGVGVLEGEREAGCEVVGGVADEALYMVQFDGTFY